MPRGKARDTSAARTAGPRDGGAQAARIDAPKSTTTTEASARKLTIRSFAQNDPNRLPSSITTINASSAPTIAVTTMSR